MCRHATLLPSKSLRDLHITPVNGTNSKRVRGKLYTLHQLLSVSSRNQIQKKKRTNENKLFSQTFVETGNRVTSVRSSEAPSILRILPYMVRQSARL